MLIERYADALQLAWRLHDGQVRKGTAIPYISHLLGVSSLALEHGATEDEATAALLHDAVEDAGGKPTLEMIRARFGEAVADIVDGCTDAYGDPKPPWRARKHAYIQHLAAASPSVRLVSNSDKLHNARSILSDLRILGPALWNRFTARNDGTPWYYRSLVAAFAAHGRTPRERVRPCCDRHRGAGRTVVGSRGPFGLHSSRPGAGQAASFLLCAR